MAILEGGSPPPSELPVVRMINTEIDYYILNDDHSLTKTTLDGWSDWSHNNPELRWIAWTGNENKYVSTIFLGFDHQIFTGYPRQIFETMAFIGREVLTQRRYSTWDEAMAGHKECVQEYMVRNKTNA